MLLLALNTRPPQPGPDYDAEIRHRNAAIEINKRIADKVTGDRPWLRHVVLAPEQLQHLEENGQKVWSDKLHLTARGNEELLPVVFAALAETIPAADDGPPPPAAAPTAEAAGASAEAELPLPAWCRAGPMGGGYETRPAREPHSPPISTRRRTTRLSPPPPPAAGARSRGVRRRWPPRRRRHPW